MQRGPPDPAPIAGGRNDTAAEDVPVALRVEDVEKNGLSRFRFWYIVEAASFSSDSLSIDTSHARPLLPLTENPASGLHPPLRNAKERPGHSRPAVTKPARKENLKIEYPFESFQGRFVP